VARVDRELLGRGVDVVEMQADYRAVIPAERAAAAGFLDQDALDLLMPAGNGLADTPLALPSIAILA
jgi:hypothetical protein